MKRIAAIAGVLVILTAAGFIWLVGQSGPDHAPKDVVTVDLEDNYER